MIADRKLKPGTTLVARHKGKEHRCEVVAGKEGRVLYRLKDGKEFTSPSAAGSAIMAGSACNGWRFWSLAGEEQPKKARKAAAKKQTAFERLKDGRFFCSECQDAFEAPKGVEPIGCPKGHPAEEQAAT